MSQMTTTTTWLIFARDWEINDNK